MELKIISTGSNGNSYILENENESLIIDLGLSFSEIKKGINFDLDKIRGVLISHEHL